MKKQLLGLALGSALSCVGVLADHIPDDHAPIGVMGDHTHKKGEFMFSYRYMLMRMEDNRDGTDRLDESEVLLSGTGDYRVAPTEMDMVMHMLGVMYAPTDRITLMLMIPYLDSEMDHVTATGGAFTTKSSDLGDVSLSMLSSTDSGLMWQMGLSFPTGDQDQRDMTPMGNSVLPYPMQIGSGTYDLVLGLGRINGNDKGSTGFKLDARVRLGENDDDYTVGDTFSATAWYARRLADSVSVSVRGLYEYRGNYDGNDPRYQMAQMINLVPTVDPDLRGGQRLDMALGLNWVHTSGHRLAFEYQLPVWQDLDGPQLETDGVLTIGWQKAL